MNDPIPIPGLVMFSLTWGAVVYAVAHWLLFRHGKRAMPAAILVVVCGWVLLEYPCRYRQWTLFAGAVCWVVLMPAGLYLWVRCRVKSTAASISPSGKETYAEMMARQQKSEAEKRKENAAIGGTLPVQRSKLHGSDELTSGEEGGSP